MLPYGASVEHHAMDIIYSTVDAYGLPVLLYEVGGIELVIINFHLIQGADKNRCN